MGHRCLISALAVLLFFSIPAGSAAAAEHYSDPFAYCAAAGTIDQPDSRYVGDPIPRSIARGLRAAFGLPPTASLEPFMRGTFWRCMDGKVYACNVGANLPCETKADTSQTPSAAMVAFCQGNPDSDVIPAVVTGRATVYQWRCTGGEPSIVRQVTTPDARGYLSNIWYEIKPTA